ncbi:energy-coupling factor transporter ATPase [Salsuginibacillus kocurii]|uniref:energy-coupling factor transporter ATPase n=1 Tax=Salsuginibacillus kocurii TaxID=427078 RepID=UPI00035F34E5|nr:energy-coupling factor transporter ATPase [Salsuginibacillus kocurii]
MAAAIYVEDVWFQYKEEDPAVVQDLSLSIGAREFVAVLGRNGSGKSTFAHMINGLLLPTRGKVEVKGRNVADEANHSWLRQRVGMVFQNPEHQFVAATVRDDIAFGLENIGMPREKMIERIEWSAKKTGISELLDAEPHRLSGGQKQRAAIAGVLALKPSILVFDEATSMLDPYGRKEVLATLTGLFEEENITIIMITHDIKEALQAERILVLEEGKLLLDQTPAGLCNEGDRLRARGYEWPYFIEMQQELTRQGVHLPTYYVTEEEWVEALWMLSSKM